MKTRYILLSVLGLAFVVLVAIAADKTITQLPLITSPSTGTFIEVQDTNTAPQGRSYLLTNLTRNWVDIGTNSMLAGTALPNAIWVPNPSNTNLGMIIIGTGGVTNNTINPGFMVNEAYVDGSGWDPAGANPHSFVDVSVLDRTNGVSMASFDASATVSGTNSYGHYAGHKSRLYWTGGGTLGAYYGHWSDYNTTGSTGAITAAYLYYGADDNGSTGHIGTNYGIYIGPLTKATNNYGAYIHGSVGIGTAVPAYMLHVKTNNNGRVAAFVENSNTGSGAFADIGANNNIVNGYSRIVALGSGYTTSGGFMRSAGVFEVGSAMTNGMSFISRHASGDIRFYTAGIADANERAVITSTGVINALGTVTAPQVSITNYLSFGGTQSTNQLYAVGTNLFWNGKQVTVAP